MNAPFRLLSTFCRSLPAETSERVAYAVLKYLRFLLPEEPASGHLRFSKSLQMHGLLPADNISSLIMISGSYEPRLSAAISQLARDSKNFQPLLLDVGANMGYFSLLWLGNNPRARTIAVEASSQNVFRLESNLQRNGLIDRADVLPCAAGDRAGSITFDPGPAEQTGWGGICNNLPAKSCNAVNVPMRTVDEIVGDQVVDVMKIDVEGADTLVLRGSIELLRRRQVGTIFFEENLPRMRSLGIQPGEAQSLLTSYGYCCQPFMGCPTEFIATLK